MTVTVDIQQWEPHCAPRVWAWSRDYRTNRNFNAYTSVVEELRINGQLDRVSHLRLRTTTNRRPISNFGWTRSGWGLSSWSSMEPGNLSVGRNVIELPLPYSGYEVDYVIVGHGTHYLRCGGEPPPDPDPGPGDDDDDDDGGPVLVQ